MRIARFHRDAGLRIKQLLDVYLRLWRKFQRRFAGTRLLRQTQRTGLPFYRKSGTGKSTHSNLWLKNIPGTDLINDDNPIIRLINGSPVLFGSPWSGKTPCYRPIDAPLGAITRIARAPVNSIERLAPVQAFASLLPACSTMKWDSTIYDNICNSITAIIETTPIYTLHCLPDDAAAILCHSTIAR